jgi:hypothetical protein
MISPFKITDIIEYIPIFKSYTEPAATPINESIISKEIPIGKSKYLLDIFASISVPPVDEFTEKAIAMPMAEMKIPKNTAIKRSSPVYFGKGIILSKKSTKKLSKKVQIIVLTPKDFPIKTKEMMKRKKFTKYIKIPTGRFIKPFRTTAIPLAPPAAMLLGIRKDTNPTAVKATPITEIKYSLKILLFNIKTSKK